MANEEVLELQIRDNAAVAVSGLQELATALTRVKNAVGKGLNLKGTVSGLEKLKNAVTQGLDDATINRWEKLANVLERLKSVGALKISGIKNIANQLQITDSLNDAKDAAQDTGNAIANAIDAGMENVQSRSIETGNSIKEAFSGAKEKVIEVAKGIKDAVKESYQKPGGFLNDLKNGIGKAREGLHGMLADFGRIVKYRLIRSIIKQITEAFTTGVKNVYMYSKAIGSSLAPAMDDAASVLLQFKNSIGAAVAPLIQQLIPVLKTVVGWAIEAFNYLNQFFALLRGQSTWTKALYKPVQAFEDTKKAAKGARKEIKDMLADWDELNIIQSESGGGSGGAAQAAEDYTKMFEEEAKFDSWLSDHFKDILEYIKLAGAALAAWKFSKLFTGPLNKLFKLLAGTLLLKLGIELSYDAGFDIAQNGFTTENIIKAIGGALAAGLGGYLITSAIGLGGGIGFAIGIGVAVIATLVGYIEGKKDLADKNKWGNLSWTQEQIEQFVTDQFTFDVKAEVNILDGAIQNAKIAKENLDAKIDAFKKSLTDANIQAGISIDSSETGATVKNASEDAIAAIRAVEGLISTQNEGLNVILKTFSFTDADGKDISKELLEKISIADTSLQDYFINLGAELAKLIEQGESEHWENADTTKAALALMERERRILEEAKQYQSEIEFDTTIKAGYKNVVDRDTARQIFEQQQLQLSEYETKAKQLFEEQANGYAELAGLAKAAAKDALEQNDLTRYEELMSAYNTYMGKALEFREKANTEVDKKLADTRKAMAEEWAKTLQKVYEEDFMTEFTSGEFAKNLRVNTRTINANNPEYAAEWLKDYITKALIGDDPNGIVEFVLGELNGDVYSLLTKEMKKQITDNLLEIVGGDKSKVNAIWQEMFNRNYFTEPTQKVIRDTKEAITKAMESGGEMTQREISQIVDHFGQDAYDAAMKELETSLNTTVTPEWAVEPELVVDVKGEEIRKIYKDITDAIEKSGLENAQDLYTQAFDLFSSGNLETLKQLQQFIDWNGVTDAFERLDNYMKGKGWVTGRLGAGTLANTGMASAGGYEPTTIDTSAETDSKMKTNIENGMKAANEPQNDLLRAMIVGLDNLNRKQWTVNITPSSTLGAVNSRSNRMYGMVTGETQ